MCQRVGTRRALQGMTGGYDNPHRKIDPSGDRGNPAQALGPADVTSILDRAAAGDAQATERLFPLVYEELRKLAASLMAREKPGQTIQPTALVNEAYLRLVGPGDVHWQNRAHFFGAAATAMRRILIDRARHMHAMRKVRAVSDAASTDGLDRASDLPALDSRTESSTPSEILELDRAMQALAARDPRQHEVVMLRFFAGLTVEQAAEVLGKSAATVKNDWAFARAWLTAEIRRHAAR